MFELPHIYLDCSGAAWQQRQPVRSERRCSGRHATLRQLQTTLYLGIGPLNKTQTLAAAACYQGLFVRSSELKHTRIMHWTNVILSK